MVISHSYVAVYQRVVSCWRHPDTIAAELTWPLRATCLRWRSVYVLVEHIPSGVLAITRPRAGRHNPVIWNELSPPHFSIFFHLFLILRRCSDVVTWVLSKISDPNSSGLVDVPRQVRPDTKRFGAWLMPCTRPWCLPPGRKRGDFWHFGPNKHGDLFFLPPKDRGEFGPTTVLMGFVFLLDILMGIEPAKHWQTFCTTDVKCEARDFCPFFVQISEHRPLVKWIRIPHALHDPSVVSIRGFVLIQEVDSKASIHALAGHSTKRNGGMSMKEHGPKSLHHIASYWMVKD